MRKLPKPYYVNIILLALLIVTGFHGSIAYGQGRATDDGRFYQDIRRTFDSRQWTDVLQRGEAFRLQFRKSVHESSVTYLMAQAALNLRDLDKAIVEADHLKLKFPNSTYVDDARWIKAQAALMAERWDEAAGHLRWIIGFSGEADLKNKARIQLTELTEFQTKLLALNSRPDKSLSPRPWVALLLPFTGLLKNEAEEFRQGFQIRWDKENIGNLAIYDTGGEPVRAVRLARRLAFEDSIWAIVGGLEPSESAALAAVAEADEIPFLTTACGVEGIAAIGRHVFQGRIDYAGVGRELASYAITEKGLGTFAILAPQNQEGLQLAGGFKRQIEELGMELLSEEIYYPGTQDLKSYFARIRGIGLRRAYDDSMKTHFSNYGYIMRDTLEFKPLLEMLEPVPPPEYGFNLPEDTTWVLTETEEDTTWTLSKAFLDSIWEADHIKLREWMVETEQEIDSLEIPVEVIDGFLLVIDPGQVVMVAPQFARANIKTQLLGGEMWADRDALVKEQSYINGLVYAEPLAASGGSEYYEFASEIIGDSTAMVSRYHLAGERAASMMLFAAAKSSGAEGMRIALSQIRDLETLSGMVSLLKEERIDRRVKLMKFMDGYFEELK